jgi:glutathione synthase
MVSTPAYFARANHLMFHNAFRSLGHDVEYVSLLDMEVRSGQFYSKAVQPDRDVQVNDDFRSGLRPVSFAEFDLLWLLDRPHPSAVQDVYQLLWLASQKHCFVNSPEGIVFLNNKHNLSAVVPSENLIPTYSSNSFTNIENYIRASACGKWVAKPPNQGFGADVYVIDPTDSNHRPLLQSLSGNELALHEIYRAATVGQVAQYCIIQDYVPAVMSGEKRVVLAGGEVIGAYGKMQKKDKDGLNRGRYTDQVATQVTAEEHAVSARIAENLKGYGINYAGIDMSFPYVFEINLVTPGGLQSIDRIQGIDLTPRAAKAILRSVGLLQEKAELVPAG